VNDDFFTQLPAHQEFSVLASLSSYRPLPEDWLVCIADVANWTGAIKAGRYKSDFVRNSDYRKCDDLLRVILPGTAQQHDRLEAYLAEAFAEGRLVYGCHRAPELITTCLVDSYQHMHQHFIDTAQGGYARAAEGLKRRIAATREAKA